MTRPMLGFDPLVADDRHSCLTFCRPMPPRLNHIWSFILAVVSHEKEHSYRAREVVRDCWKSDCVMVGGVPYWLGYLHRPKSARISLVRPKNVRACLIRQNALEPFGKRRDRERKTKECVLKGGILIGNWKRQYLAFIKFTLLVCKYMIVLYLISTLVDNF